MIAFVFALVGVVIATALLQLAGWKDLAWVVSFFGTLVVVFGTFAWIVLINSKKRWPNASLLVRLGRVMFYGH